MVAELDEAKGWRFPRSAECILQLPLEVHLETHRPGFSKRWRQAQCLLPDPFLLAQLSSCKVSWMPANCNMLKGTKLDLQECFKRTLMVQAYHTYPRAAPSLMPQSQASNRREKMVNYSWACFLPKCSYEGLFSDFLVFSIFFSNFHKQIWSEVI